MDALIRKYADKLVSCGLCAPGSPLLGGLDAEITWNREAPEIPLLEEVVAGLNINSLLLARPAGALGDLLDFLGRRSLATGEPIRPGDSETRTFLHDIPVIEELAPAPVIAALKRRKNVLVPGRGIVTFGAVSPEQAFVHFSSVCFASFVKFFCDWREDRRQGRTTPEQERIQGAVVADYRALMDRAEAYPELTAGPFTSRETLLSAMLEAGRATVECGMVDSFFGNLSYLLDGTIYISQTTSSLDELAGCIDACPLDGSSCVGITASSEYTAHREVLEKGRVRAILHGHPRFSVIYSLLCDVPDCPGRGECHRKCSRSRHAGTIPIAPGEAGTGRYGLATTLPPHLAEAPGAIIYGHGLFTTGKEDFREAFRTLVATERWCFETFLRLGESGEPVLPGGDLPA